MAEPSSEGEPAMRALWVLAHPSPHSLNSHLRCVGVAALRAQGWTVEETDLYSESWDPVLVSDGGTDVQTEQDKLLAADLLILQFPLWWYGMPAIMKGWIDRVFEAGFAYDVTDPDSGKARKYGDGGLVGRRALTIVTAGDRPGSLSPRGISGSIEDVLWPLLHGTFWYTGMEALRPHLITHARQVDPTRLGALERELTNRLHQVTTEPAIPYLPMTDQHYDHAIRLHPHVSPREAGIAAHLA
jgi:NAD(P)H dehydrogenase (quinone)